jgi:uncharacterized protein (TIGR03382 family)
MSRSPFAIALALAQVVTASVTGAQDHVGLNTHVPSADLLDLCVDAGVSWVRMDGDWIALNPARGRYDWGTLDAAVTAARTRGLQVYLTLAYTPPWVPRVSRVRTDTYPGNDEPAGSDEWRSFVTEAVRHYRPLGVTHFGIWNEPNLDGFWERSAGLEAYVTKILLPGAAAVRAACSDCRVLGPDLAHVGDYHVFLEGVLRRAPRAFDILAHHTYAGWPETGTTVLSGDNFLQTLESRRFPFTRPALREVLDANGWTGDVWLTETGYRATPIGDAGAEGRQATYVRRVLEEQLARRWWTHTFFYEGMDCGVDQPACDIDGFGIARPRRTLATGPRRYPADYRVKPAFTTLRDFIRAHPAVVSRAPPSQCANGRDDDGDGRIDADDRGCANGLDDNEGDDPPRRCAEAFAVAPGSLRIDGVLDEWGAMGWISLGREAWVGTVPLLVDSDLAVRLAARWAPGVLYLAAEVTDDRHVNDRSNDSLWVGDSLQVAFDVARNYGPRYDTTDDHELTFALVQGVSRVHRFHGPAGATLPSMVAVRRDGNVTRYEIALAMTTLNPASLTRGTVLGWSFLVNDNDGAETPEGNGREGWLEWTPGIGRRKDPYLFGELHLVGEGTGPAWDASLTRDASGSDTPTLHDDIGLWDAGLDRPERLQDTLRDATVQGEQATADRAPEGTQGCACATGAQREDGTAVWGWMLLAGLTQGWRRRKAPPPRGTVPWAAYRLTLRS